MADFIDKLRRETRWSRIFLAVFAGMTLMIELLTPVVMYIFQVLIKNKEWNWNVKDLWIGLIVSLVYSAMQASAIRSKRIREQQVAEKQ